MSIGSSFNATAQTTYSEIALEDLDQDAMIDALVSLYQAANALLKFLNVQDPGKADELRRDLQIPDSRTFKRLQRFYEAFKLHKGHFGDKNYIEPEIAVRGLLRVRYWNEVGEGVWRPDNILQLANVAKLAYDLFPSSRESREAKVTLELLWETFPKNFLTDLSEATAELGGSTLVQETFRFALESRVQYAISVLMEYDNLDPDKTAVQIFYAEEDQLRGFHGPGLVGEDGVLPTQYEKPVIQVLRKMKSHFRKTEPFVDFPGLERDFPWSRFLEISNQWIQKRASELKDKISAQGGSETIQDRLQNESERRQALDLLGDDDAAPKATTPAQVVNRSPAKLLPGFQIARKSARKKASPLDVAKLRNKRMAELKKAGFKSDDVVPSSSIRNSSTVPAAAQAPSEVETDTAFNAPPSAQPDPEQQSSEIARAMNIERRADQIQTNKENNPPPKKPTFLDRQANATRESDISEDEDEDEDEFETDKRNVDIGRKRGAKPLQPSPRKRARIRRRETEDRQDDNINLTGDDDDVEVYHPSPSASTDDDANTNNGKTITNSRQPPAARHRHRHPQPTASASPARSSQQPPPPPTSSRTAPSPSSSTPSELTNSQRIAAINAQAKATRARESAAANKPPQRRRPWTQAETERLVELIEEHGCKWSLLKKMDLSHPEGAVLEGRDQVALKDKARNIKMDIYQYVLHLCSCLN